jgi:hypothetical protein
LKKHSYDKETVLGWFNAQITSIFTLENEISKGIPLQICDVFLQELNKTDSEGISFTQIAALLQPFLHSLANLKSNIVLQRIEDKVFGPLLENNVTPDNKSDGEEDTDDSSSEINYDPKRGRWVDGGKLHPKTYEEVKKMVD